MTKEHYDIWNILHDGEITGIDGVIPGHLAIRVEIPYLRDMLAPKGTAFVLTLCNCTRFEYEVWDDRKKYSDVARIAAMKPFVLEASETPEGIRIGCTEGYIHASYGSVAYALDTGQIITFADLSAACDRYWTEWKAKTAQACSRKGVSMFCQQCGKEVPEGARFCSSCGTDLTGGRALAAPAGVAAGPTARQLQAFLFFLSLGFGVVLFVGSGLAETQLAEGKQFLGVAIYDFVLGAGFVASAVLFIIQHRLAPRLARLVALLYIGCTIVNEMVQLAHGQDMFGLYEELTPLRSAWDILFWSFFPGLIVVLSHLLIRRAAPSAAPKETSP
jgi:hypothetical protein